MFTPSKIERALVARALLEGGVLIGSVDEIWTHPSAYRALGTWRMCIEAITDLIGGGHGVQPSFVKACVLQFDGISETPFALEEVADFIVSDPVARMYWQTLIPDVDYPHRCPHCSAAAFVGFLQVDCKARCVASKPRY